MEVRRCGIVIRGGGMSKMEQVLLVTNDVSPCMCNIPFVFQTPSSQISKRFAKAMSSILPFKLTKANRHQLSEGALLRGQRSIWDLSIQCLQTSVSSQMSFRHGPSAPCDLSPTTHYPHHYAMGLDDHRIVNECDLEAMPTTVALGCWNFRP
jgi:hypothetical protein